jgi:hypothetical protein
MTDKIGTVNNYKILDKVFPCVKVSETIWIISGAMKYLRENGKADSKIGDDIFITEYGL